MAPKTRSTWFVVSIVLCVALLHGDPAGQQRVPTPEEIIGFPVGADYKLASYQDAVKYFRALEQASPMIKVLDIGTTSMGKPMICAVITSAENMTRLDHYRDVSRQLALGDGLTDDDARRLADEGKAVVYIDGGLHADEVAPAQHNLQLAYDLLTGDDPDTRLIRDNTILLLGFPNPDGMDIVADWYRRNVGTPYEVSPLPWLYHVYADHDNNRDAYMLNLKETQNLAALNYRTWYPVFLINHHQTAPFPARISIPPLPEPLNPNTHPLVTRWKNLLGDAVGAALDRNRQPGAVARIVIDGWAPEMEDSVGDLLHTASTSPETALYYYATPHDYELSELPEEYRDFMPSIFYPNPWKGGVWRLKDAMDYVETFSKATLHTAAVYREKLLYDRYRMAKDEVSRYQKEAPYAWIVPQDQWDPPVAALLLERMGLMGVRVAKAESRFVSGGRTFPAGTWVIPMQQPFAGFVRSMFEEQRYPDLGAHPIAWQALVRPQKFTDGYFPPYDTAGWTLPYQMGVEVVRADEPVGVPLTPVEKVAPPARRVESRASSAYLLSPKNNNSFIAVNRILKAGGRVSRADRDFTVAGRTYPAGTWIVAAKSVPPPVVNKLALDLTIPIDGLAARVTANASPIRPPRIGVYKSWRITADEGWTRWLLEQYEFTFTSIHDAEVKAGDLARTLDVLVIPDQSVENIVNGHKTGDKIPPQERVPAQYAGGMTEAGVANLKTFVEQGGTLVLLNSASQLAIERLGVPVSDGLKGLKESGRHEDGSAGQAGNQRPPRFACPGSLLKVSFNPHHPVAFGMPERGAASFSDNSMAFEVQPGSTAVPIATYPAGDLLLSGFLRGGENLSNKVAAAEARLGKGRVILLGFPVQKRAQPHGTFKLLFNSLFWAATP